MNNNSNSNDSQTQPKKKSGCKKYAIIFLLIVLVVAALFIWWKYYNTYSEGTRAGTLQKFSRKGNIFKTWEGELLLNTMSPNSTGTYITPEKFDFSVLNDSLAHAMQGNEGKRMQVHYEEKRGTLPWRGDSRYIVVAFKLVP